MIKWDLSQECKVGLMFANQSIEFTILTYEKKKGNHRIIWIDVEKLFDKIQQPFLIKRTFRKLGIEEKFLCLMKNVYKQGIPWWSNG